jgi:thiaminase
MLHEVLWTSNFDLARSCLAHPFVVALGDGTLKPDLFHAFIAQDAFFLRAFLKAHALALARSEDATPARCFAVSSLESRKSLSCIASMRPNWESICRAWSRMRPVVPTQTFCFAPHGTPPWVRRLHQ